MVRKARRSDGRGTRRLIVNNHIMSDETKVVDVLTDEEKAQELEGRIKSLNDELLPLLGKYELGLGASAFIQPNGTIAARPVLFDARNMPKPEEAAEAAPEAVVAA